MLKLKIIHALVFYLPVRIGGIEIYVKALAKQLVNLGHEVKILVPQYPGEALYENNIDGIPILTYPESLNKKRSEFAGNAPSKNLSAFIQHIEKEKPDIVHFHQLTSSNGISLHHIKSVKSKGIKVVFTNHLAGLTCNTGTLLTGGNTPCNGKVGAFKCTACTIKFSNRTDIQGAMAAKGMKRVVTLPMRYYSSWKSVRNRKHKANELLSVCDKFIALTDWYYQVLQKNGLLNKKVAVIKQAIPAPATVKTEQHPVVNGKLRMVFVGRIFPEKGLHILLKAMQQLDASKVHLDIYGQVDGNDFFAYCKSLAQDMSNIQWRGVLSNDNVAATLSSYHVLVIPSTIAEMAPLILQEAFQAKLPVIGTRIGGLAEEITHGENGFLFTPHNIDELSNCIRQLIADSSLRLKFLSQLPRPRSFASVAQQVESEYYKLLS